MQTFLLSRFIRPIFNIHSNEKDTAASVAYTTTPNAEENTSEPQHISNGSQKVYRPTTSRPIPHTAERDKSMRQVIAAFVVNLGTMNTGLVFGFSAVAIPQLKHIDSSIHIDLDQASWIGKWLTISIFISHASARYFFFAGVYQTPIQIATIQYRQETYLCVP